MGCKRIPLPAVQLLYNVSNFKPETVIAIALTQPWQVRIGGVHM